MNLGNRITVLLLVLLVAGCATARYVDRKMSDIQPLLVAGKYEVAVSVARNDFDLDDSDSTAIRREFAKYPSSGAALKSRLKSELSALTDIGKYETFPTAVSLAARDGVITANDAKELLDQMSKLIENGNRSGLLAFNYSNVDIFTAFPSLNSTEHQTIIFDRSLQAIPESRGSKRAKLLSGVVKYAQTSGTGSPANSKLIQRIEQLKLTTPEIRQHIVPFDPTVGQRLLGARAIRLLVKSEPNDRLLEEDVRDLLKRNDDITFVTSVTPDTTVLTVGKLQYEERIIPESKQTITYRQYEVNFVGAILLMPRDASYMYEYVTGGHEVNAAFLMKIERGGNVKIDKVIRDRLSKNYQSCENARIVNVFGGVQRAEFVANEDMSRRCNSSSSRSSPNDSRTEVISKLADEVLSQLTN